MFTLLKLLTLYGITETGQEIIMSKHSKVIDVRVKFYIRQGGAVPVRETMEWIPGVTSMRITYIRISARGDRTANTYRGSAASRQMIHKIAHLAQVNKSWKRESSFPDVMDKYANLRMPAL